MSYFDFANGATFQEAIHAISDAGLKELQDRNDENALRIIRAFKKEILELRGRAKEDYLRIMSDMGMVSLLQEDAALASQIGAENRFSGPQNKKQRTGAWDELQKLAEVDPFLAARGGRFSGNRIQNLRDVLHMRIDEFCEYGAEHGLLNPDLKVVYSEEVRKKIYEFIDKQKMAAGKAPDVNEVLLLQRVLNKNYDLAADARGKRPDGYAFKPVNLIAAVGFTVRQLCKFSGLDEAPFVGHKYSDPTPVRYTDPANDQAANLLQVEYTVLESEADQKILKSGIENPEKMIENINKTFPDIKARVSAKVSVVKYIELQAAIRQPEQKPPGAGQ